MPKRLNGSAGTGEKIMNNPDIFNYSYIGPDNSTGTTNYSFKWSFGSQSGTAVISLTKDNRIDPSSTLNCCTDFCTKFILHKFIDKINII